MITDRIGLNMYHVDFIIVIKGVLCTGGKVSILTKSQLSKIYRFSVWVWLYKT